VRLGFIFWRVFLLVGGIALCFFVFEKKISPHQKQNSNVQYERGQKP